MKDGDDHEDYFGEEEDNDSPGVDSMKDGDDHERNFGEEEDNDDHKEHEGGATSIAKSSVLTQILPTENVKHSSDSLFTCTLSVNLHSLKSAIIWDLDKKVQSGSIQHGFSNELILQLSKCD